MNLFGRIFKKKIQDKPLEQAVIIHFQYGIHNLQPLFSLCENLRKSMESKDVGEFDGHDISVDYSDGLVYMYGPDADAIFQTIKPVIEATPFLNGATVIIRYGPLRDGVKERVVKVTF